METKEQLTKSISRTYVVCPHCKEPAGSIDHLSEGKGAAEFSWYCDHCGVQYSFTIKSGTVQTVWLTGKRVEKTLAFLRNGDVGLVVRGMRFLGEPGLDDGPDHDAYFYDEHTCPTNYMPSVLAVIDLKKRDVDPHGIFHYVTTLPYDERIECRDSEFMAGLIEHFNNGNNHNDSDSNQEPAPTA